MPGPPRHRKLSWGFEIWQQKNYDKISKSQSTSTCRDFFKNLPKRVQMQPRSNNEHPHFLRYYNTFFKFQISKFQIPKLQIPEFKIPNSKTSNSKFKIPKLQIPKFQIFKFQNFKFQNSKFPNSRFQKFKISKSPIPPKTKYF